MTDFHDGRTTPRDIATTASAFIRIPTVFFDDGMLYQTSIRIDKQLDLDLTASRRNELLQMTRSKAGYRLPDGLLQSVEAIHPGNPSCTRTDIRLNQQREREIVRQTVLGEKSLRMGIPLLFAEPHQILLLETGIECLLVRKTGSVHPAQQISARILQRDDHIEVSGQKQVFQIRPSC